MSALNFEITSQDETTHARAGQVTTPHGVFETPAFMPVGTQGTVKGLIPDQVRDTGAQIILGNTYHLMLRPGSELVARHGGLQNWTRWQGPMLTDSGGFQVFSLAEMNKITDEGAAAFLEVLEKNTTCTNIFLSSNKTSPDVCDDLWDKNAEREVPLKENLYGLVLDHKSPNQRKLEAEKKEASKKKKMDGNS